MICTPGNASAVKTALRGLSPFPDTGMALSGVVGKSHRKGTGGEWDSVGPVRVHSQLKVLLSSMEGIEVVNDVRDILGTVPQLNRLVLLGCPSISSENIRDLLDAEHQLLYHLEALIHPFLPGMRLTPGLIAMPFHTSDFTVAILSSFFHAFHCHSNFDRYLYHSYSFLYTPLAMQAAFSSLRAPGQNGAGETRSSCHSCRSGL